MLRLMHNKAVLVVPGPYESNVVLITTCHLSELLENCAQCCVTRNTQNQRAPCLWFCTKSWSTVSIVFL